MNPAALITQLSAVEKGGTVIVNEDGFSDHNLRKAGYESNPLEDDSLDDYQLFRVPDDVDDGARHGGHRGHQAAPTPQRCKNLFALGLVSWMYGRPTEPSRRLDREEVRRQAAGARRQPGRLPRRLQLRRDGRAARPCTTRSTPAPAPPGTYRNVNGTQALAYGLIAASVQLAGCGCSSRATRSRPPRSCCTSCRATSRFGVRTIQAEDEIAAANMALGAAFGGRLGVTATSGPGMDLKAETIGLAVALELPLVVVDVQRAGPVDRACRPRPRRPTC